jgi:hypothetical protein
VKFFEAPTTRYVDVYLSGDENEQLRQGFGKPGAGIMLQ